MKNIFIAVALFAVSSAVFADQGTYVDRRDVESGRVVVTGPVAGTYTNVTVIYPPTGCSPPYVPNFSGGCYLPQYLYVPAYPTTFSLFYYRSRR
jgi:hypothetical protein